MKIDVLKKIKKYIDFNKEGVEILKNYEQFFAPGRYKYVNRGKRIFYNARSKEVLKVIESSGINLRQNSQERENFKSRLLKHLKKRIRKCATEFFSVNIYLEGTGEFNGSLGMVTSFKEVKIFNFKKKKVLTHINSQGKYNSTKKAYTNFNKYFNTLILQFNDEGQYYIERYLEFEPSSKWSIEEKDRIITEIFERYTCYFEDCKKKQIQMVKIEEVVKGWEKNLVIRKLIAEDVISLKNILSLTFPQLPLHGDLHSGNILFDTNQIYFIDFELYGNYTFFYDLIVLIYEEFISGRNDMYLTNYIKGKYDSGFKEIFEIFDLKYNENMKKEYLTIVVLERIMKIGIRSDERFLQLFNSFEEIKREI